MLFLLARDLWLGLNIAVYLVALWYATLPPIEGMHPGFLLAPIWLVLLFPGNIAMVLVLALLNLVIPPSVFAWAGPILFFTVWAAGGVLTYAFWFRWLPRGVAALSDRLRARRRPPTAD